jgi:hypothetical protein
MNSFGFRVIAIVTLTFASICASVAKERWATYSNPRFGTTADYPADLFTVLLQNYGWTCPLIDLGIVERRG